MLHLPAPLRLKQAAKVEPQIIVWLNSISMLMEGQAGSWRRVLLQQPTRNSLGAWGNDLPALYLLDQNDGVETMMYFDVSYMDWMSMENLPRFLVYRCSNVSRIERDGTQRMGVGLIADQATGDTLPAGDIHFIYWLLQRPMKTLINEQQAVTRWIEALLPLFEEKLAWPAVRRKLEGICRRHRERFAGQSHRAGGSKRPYRPARLRERQFAIVAATRR